MMCSLALVNSIIKHLMLNQKERRKYLRQNIKHLYEGSISILKIEIYFWRKKKKKSVKAIK